MKSIVYGSYLVLYHNDKDRFNKCNKIDIGDTQGFRFIPDYIKDLEYKLKTSEAECERLKRCLIQASEADWSEELNSYVRQLKKLKEKD